MSTLFTVGCSHTSYVWPTFADILGLEYDTHQNWGLSGIGNYAIMIRAVELLDSYKDGDTVIVQWTYPTRFDFHRHGDGWYQGGNIHRNHDGVQNTVLKYAYDQRSWDWQTKVYIELVETYYENKNINYIMLAPDFKVGSYPQLDIMDTFGIQKRRFINVRPTEIVGKHEDHHWTPAHHLKYLEQAGFTITEKMKTYVDEVEKILDDTSDWKWINYRMQQEGYIKTNAYGR